MFLHVKVNVMFQTSFELHVCNKGIFQNRNEEIFRAFVSERAYHAFVCEYSKISNGCWKWGGTKYLKTTKEINDLNDKNGLQQFITVPTAHVDTIIFW